MFDFLKTLSQSFKKEEGKTSHQKPHHHLRYLVKVQVPVSPTPPKSRLPDTGARHPSSLSLSLSLGAYESGDLRRECDSEETAGKVSQGWSRSGSEKLAVFFAASTQAPPHRHQRALAPGAQVSRKRLQASFTCPSISPLMSCFPLSLRSCCQRRSSGQLPAGLHHGLGGVLQTAGCFLRPDVRASSGPQPGV